jgi:hypothetical protein
LPVEKTSPVEKGGGFEKWSTALRAGIILAIFVKASLREAFTKIAIAYSSENGYKWK